VLVAIDFGSSAEQQKLFLALVDLWFFCSWLLDFIETQALVNLELVKHMTLILLLLHLKLELVNRNFCVLNLIIDLVNGHFLLLLNSRKLLAFNFLQFHFLGHFLKVQIPQEVLSSNLILSLLLDGVLRNLG
jgi:hypothetical protein